MDEKELSRETRASRLIELMGLHVKDLILAEARENLRPFPEMMVARAMREDHIRYRRSKKIRGLLIHKEEKPFPGGYKYYILTPKGIFCYDGTLTFKGGTSNPLPRFGESFTYELTREMYIGFSRPAFRAIDEEVERRVAFSNSSE